jgi:hypothetical protein
MGFEIKPIKDVYYPLEEAIQKASEQNVRRDHRLHLISTDKLSELSEEDQKKYVDEAARLLAEFGVNYVPNWPDDERIRVTKVVYLPMEEAVAKGVEQYVEYCYHKGIYATPDLTLLPEAEKASCERIVIATLREHGQYFIRGFNTKEHIFVKQEG